MKTPALFLPLMLATAVNLAAAPAPTKDDPAAATPTAATLQVQIVVPPTWRPMLEDDIADTFVGQIRDVFRHRGFKGDIKQVDSYVEPDAGCCLITVNLIEWRINHIGNVDCTFAASLQTEHAVRNLGLFTQTAFRWMSGPGRFGLGDAFNEAAEGAIRELYDDIAKTGLIAGLARR